MREIETEGETRKRKEKKLDDRLPREKENETSINLDFYRRFIMSKIISVRMKHTWEEIDR